MAKSVKPNASVPSADAVTTIALNPPHRSHCRESAESLPEACDVRGLEAFEIRIAAQHVGSVFQDRAAVGPAETKMGAPVMEPTPAGRLRGVFSKGVPKSRDGPHESGVGRIVPKRGANLGDKVDQVLLDDEGIGPEPFLKLQLRKRLRPLNNEDLEELVRLG